VIQDIQLLGFLTGDGWRYQDNYRNYLVGFTQSFRNVDILNHYKLRLQQLGKVYQKIKVNRNACDIYTKNKQFFKLFGEFLRNFPHSFEVLSEVEKKKFIAGFIDAEGNVAKDRCRVYNSNYSLLNTIRSFLKELNIHAILYRDREIWVLEIKHSNLNRFYKLIRFYSIKLNRLLTCAPYTRA